MGLFRNLLGRLGRISVDMMVVTLLLILIPGLPPYIRFESFRNTPAMELVGKLEPNNKLDRATAILNGEVVGPESIAIRGNELYTGLIGGNVIKYVDGKASLVAKFGLECEGKWEEKKCGRPLGMRFSSEGRLIVADAYYGIFNVDVDKGKVETLVSSNDTIDGKLPMNPNDLDIAKDGSIYWSDSSTHSYLQDAIDEFLGEPSGRLIRTDPKTKKSEVLLNGLHFANGVQLSKDEEFVVVSESVRSRVMKYHLKGDKKGTSEVFIDGLPGSPDNIRSNGRGGFYISLIAPRYSNKSTLIDILGPVPYARKFLLRILHIIKIGLYGVNTVLPNEYAAKAEYYAGHLEPIAQMLPKHSIILEVDRNGNVIRSFHGRSKVHHISEISLDNEGKFAYLGSPYNTQIWKVDVEELNTCAKKIVEINMG
ncbi:unnamed protein product [Orchesella dallaii]|uniref:Strictosidine synthase conserved region domain-containing protein n=1 Tax=Orchesella dallaii TaxID=48710 RepID=A0ABP1QWV6_9HEXA